MEMNVPNKKYIELESFEQVIKMLNKYKKEYNGENRVKLDLVLFNDAV